VGRDNVCMATTIALHVTNLVLTQASCLRAQTQRKSIDGRQCAASPCTGVMISPTSIGWPLTAVSEDGNIMAEGELVGENLCVNAMSAVVVKVMNHQRNIQSLHRLIIVRVSIASNFEMSIDMQIRFSMHYGLMI